MRTTTVMFPPWDSTERPFGGIFCALADPKELAEVTEATEGDAAALFTNAVLDCGALILEGVTVRGDGDEDAFDRAGGDD
mmetsp:Transcript_36187/g.96129  ORF Transcript_36187/g.96129 Transcript_36187/m.96129 type:complete len:80 (-) Transcript_36187:229-468(-)